MKFTINPRKGASLFFNFVQMNIRGRLILFVLANFVVYLSFVLLTGLFSRAVLVLRLPSNSLTSHQATIVDWCVMLLETGYIMVVDQPSMTQIKSAGV